MLSTRLYADRRAAGKAVAAALTALAGRDDVVVLGLARGGVAVARTVADELRAPLDVVVARKLGVPGMPEVAFGAVAEGRRDIVEDSVRWYLGVASRVVAKIAARERAEIARRVSHYRGGGALTDVRGRTVVLVDDGLASGATLRAAALAVRASKPARIIAAVPVASAAHCDDVRRTVDELVTVATPEPFETVSAWYEDFSPVGDLEVLRLLGRLPPDAEHRETGPTPDSSDEREVRLQIDSQLGDAGCIVGDLGLPNERPAGLVILAHGGGSSRNSYRNRYLAGRLRLAGWATLRVDLLHAHEKEEDDASGHVRFDIARIGRRLTRATEWAVREQVPGAHRLVLFGASTGAAAAMITAATRPDLVAAVCSRGGRVDLAADALRTVRVPVLMVVGSNDEDTMRLNHDATQILAGPARLTTIVGAGHTFDEPGAIGAVGEHIVRWLSRTFFMDTARSLLRRGWRSGLKTDGAKSLS